MRSKTSDASVVHGTYGAAGGKVAVLSNRGGAVDVVVLVLWKKHGCREQKEYIDAVGGAVMTPQRKPVLPWLLRIEELRIVVSTNDAERNTTTHAVGWSLKLSVDSGGWLVAMRVNYFASFLCMADG
ncbi:hypothetical protein NC652_006668 [Populus alba x Populus x berolinensis]|uniref:Uncharacterized protein n=1 Tax=Populus alba x Populus x berolinensis TaxID=444605 RepID=A0AAD6REW9_9ROSI|nr:hypothetical protein NC652_006668 [Populus alba x Populus x berolinensis]KAJ7007608.1 hypothetical protein NC653_006595 [Populus alba x Populus x berolinensis]